MKKGILGLCIAAICAGMVNGLLGAGGGMLLVPLLGLLSDLKQEQTFPFSVCVILPICVISLLMRPATDLNGITPYLIGSGLGGLLAGCLGKHIPITWLHRALGLLILWGGIRYIW